MLEIFPMQATTDIAAISTYLETVIERPAAEIKERIQEGRLIGARSDLGHNGKLSIQVEDLGGTIERLEAVCRNVLRGQGRLADDGLLEPYFAAP